MVSFGVDELLADIGPTIVNRRWGIVTNDAARLAHDPGRRTRNALLDAGVQIERVFSPEHGITAAEVDGKAVPDGRDPATGRPLTSLYGARQQPPGEQLRSLDGILFDLPHLDVRFYTYAWTLSHVLEVCAETNVPVVVLDRFPPAGAEMSTVEGPILNVTQISGFLGRAPIPITYNLTMGEFALWLTQEWGLTVDLRVIQAKGWRRSEHWPETGLSFVPLSPSMPSYETSRIYPGTCLFEGTNVSVGRGTETPFQLIGAPWFEPDGVTSALHGSAFGSEVTGKVTTQADGIELPPLQGVSFHPMAFTPSIPPHAGTRCRGIRLSVDDAHEFRPVRTGLVLLLAVIHLHPEHFAWRPYPTAANPSGNDHFERLIGSRDVRPLLEDQPGRFCTRLDTWLEPSGWASSVEGRLLYE